MDTSHFEHLKMIQKVIDRMAQNSFLLRGWSVTLATGMLAVAVAEEKRRFAFLALLPALALWGLDAFYLRQERLFRGLHDNVCLAFGSKDATTFSMDTRNIQNVRSWFKTLFAKVVIGLHGPLLVVILTAALLVHRDALSQLITCVAAVFRR
jgi:hypothetical protein